MPQTSIGHIQFNVQPENIPYYRDLFGFLGWQTLYDGEGMLGVGGPNNSSLWFSGACNEVTNDYDGAGFNHIGLPTFEPRGAFYAFPKVSITGLDDDTFANRLLQEEKVAVVPGNAFGAGGEGYVRCSYATAYQKIETALERIERFVKRS